MALGRLRIGRYPFWQVTKRGRAMGVQSREWLMGTPVAEVPPHDPGNFCTWDGRYPFWQVTKRGRAMGVKSRAWLTGTPMAEVPLHDPGNFCTWDNIICFKLGTD